MYILVFHVPVTHLEVVKEALFAAGAGRMGNYEKCSWQIEGEGQFLPLEGSSPFIGKEGEVERVKEYRVEMVVKEYIIKDVIQALIESHPYEVPSYHLIPTIGIEH